MNVAHEKHGSKVILGDGEGYGPITLIIYNESIIHADTFRLHASRYY